jgi:hypothetical protein
MRVIAALATVLLLLGLYYFTMVRPGELGQKEAWSVLQRVEADHRGDPDSSSPLVLKNALDSGYTILGLPATDQKYRRVWLIVNNAGAGPALKVLPAGVHFKLQCSYVRNLQRDVQIDKEVAAYLMSSCLSQRDAGSTL